jgi:hypothetical protein
MCYDKLLWKVAPYIIQSSIGTIDDASCIIIGIYVALGVGIISS